MTRSCRSWWRNCALHADKEVIAIDAMEDRIAPIGASVSRIRELISSLELCHHKADRWVYNIIAAIGSGSTTKGLGSRSPDKHHPREAVWRNACSALSAWCAGCSGREVDLPVGTITASRLLASLGDRSSLKEWQVQRVIEKIRSVLDCRSGCDPAKQYDWLLLSAAEHEAVYLDRCPPKFKAHEDFWRTTVRTFIHDSENGNQADLSLALAIDMLWPCHWAFEDNLRLVLEAIGGKLKPQKPFAACGRNIHLTPFRQRMMIVSNTLKVFYASSRADPEVDGDLLLLLGKPSGVKQWLAASLDKTIRLQLSPPGEIRAISSLAGPEWIKH